MLQYRAVCLPILRHARLPQCRPLTAVKPPPGDSAPPPPKDLKETLLDALNRYDRSYTYRGWHLLRIVGSAGIATAAAAAYFRDPIYAFLSGQGSELARRTMGDAELQREVDRVTARTADNLLNDPRTVEVTVEFLLRLLRRDETRSQAAAFLSRVASDPESVRALSDLLGDPVFLGRVRDAVGSLLRDGGVRDSLNRAAHRLLEDPGTADLLERLVVDLLRKESVRRGAAEFAADVVRHREVVDAAADSSRDVIDSLSRDERVHEDLASAGLSSVKRMILPQFYFRVAAPRHGLEVANPEEGSEARKD